MKKQIKIVAALFMSLSLLLSGCSKSDDTSGKGETLKAVNEDDYASLLPYQPSDASQKHASLSTNLNDTFTIGNGLMELSKEYFSPNTYTFKEGVFLDYDTLDATADYSGLLGRYNKSSNTMGLNPEIGTKFPTDDGEKAITAGDLPLVDIYEFDWYKSGELKGLSLAFVLNDKLGDELSPSTITKEKLQLYAEESVRKTVNYLRKKVPEVGNNTPIFVALYNINTTDETLPGTFFSTAYFESKINAEFHSMNESWQLFPTSAASKNDGTTATSFDRFKSSFKDVMPQDVSIVGKGHYVNGSLTELRINVTMHAKSSGEVKTGIQLINDKLSVFATSYPIVVDINSDNTHAAVIKRDKGNDKTTVITLI